MNINKFLCENSAIFGLFLDCTLIWALNLSSQFLMAHILGQLQAEKDLNPRFPLPRVILQPPYYYYIKHGLWYQMAFKKVISESLKNKVASFCEEISQAAHLN